MINNVSHLEKGKHHLSIHGLWPTSRSDNLLPKNCYTKLRGLSYWNLYLTKKYHLKPYFDNHPNISEFF
jgi:hypothetical protein